MRRSAVATNLSGAALASRSIGNSLRDYVEARLRTGEYPVGSWLPSVRELAALLGVNRNTASRVYQELGTDGMVRRVPGRGMLVVKKPPQTSGRSHAENGDLLAETEDLLRRAYRSGMTLPQVHELISRAGAALQAERRVQVALAECNQEAATSLAAKLAAHLHMPVEPLLISNATGRRWKRGTVLVTTFLHLNELTRSGPSPRLVGVKHELSYDTLKRITALGAAKRVLLVCPNARTLERVEQAIRPYTTATITPVRPSKGPALSKLLASADAAIVAWGAHEAVEALRPRVPVIVVEYEFDAHSLGEVQRAIGEAAVSIATPREDSGTSRRQRRPDRAAPVVSVAARRHIRP